MRIAFLIAILCSAAPGEVRKLTILHTNDLHARTMPDDRKQGGFAYVVAALRAERSGCGHCIHLSAGDLVQGSPVSTIFRGAPIFEIANRFGIDAFALGNHEFDYGWRQIAVFRRKARFPVLSANVTDGGGHPLADATHVILQAGGLRVAVIGAVMGDLREGYTTPTTAGPIRVAPVVETVSRLARELRSQADVVVALGHIQQREGSRILRDTPDVNVVVEGHSHRGIDEMDVAGDRVRVGLRGYGVEIGRLDLEVDTSTGKLTSWKWKRIPIDSTKIQPAPDVAGDVARWEARVARIVDKPIGEARRDLAQPDLKPIIEQAMREETKADFAYMNPGGIRDRLPRGVILERHIWNIQPFENRVMTARMKGSSISETLRARRPVDPDREYVVTLHDFSTGNPDQRKLLGIDGVSFTDSGRDMRQLLIDWVRKRKTIE